MAKFFFGGASSQSGIAKTFGSLAAGLYKLGRENILDKEIVNSKAGFDFSDYPLDVLGVAAMTVTNVNVSWAKYALIGNILFVKFRVLFTTGGVAGTSVRVLLPNIPGVVPRHQPNDGVNLELDDGGWDVALGFYFTPNSFYVYKRLLAAYNLGANRQLRANFWIEVARQI